MVRFVVSAVIVALLASQQHNVDAFGVSKHPAVFRNPFSSTQLNAASSVWVQLYYERQDEPKGQPVEIEPIPKNIGALKGLVYARKSKSLQQCDPDDLTVFSPDTTQPFSEQTPIRGDKPLEEVINELEKTKPPTSYDHPLIVVAPAPQQQPEYAANTQKNQELLELVEFKPHGKKVLEQDKLAKKVGGLLDRQDTIQQICCGLEKMARKMRSGTAGSLVDKKRVPLIGIIGKSETGKTELLRWIFNNCCTFQEAPTDAEALLQKLNGALPDGVAALQNLLVLFASFNQDSPYVIDEGPIIKTTMERLLRSFHGNVDFGSDNVRYEGFYHWKDVTDKFRNASGNTGFIFLLDELSSLKDKNELVYRSLMDSILGFSQKCLKNGIFCAVIGSSLSVYDLGDVVVTRSGRPIEPVSFPNEMPDMEKEVTRILRDETGIFAGFEGHLDDVELDLMVSMKVIQSSSSVKSWEPYVFGSPTRSTIAPPNIHYTMPKTIDADYVFLLASRTVLKREIAENFQETDVKAIVDHLSGSLVVETNFEGLVNDWNNPRGTFSLPGWRLFQFGVTKSSPQLFQLVQNWVLVETRNMFYTYGAGATTKTWEVTIMALLELRKAMLQAVNDSEPSLGDLIEGVRVHHNLSQELLDMKASSRPAAGQFSRLPCPEADISEPTIFLSSVSNEKAVEGVLRECFKDGTIFFQMKLYQKVADSQISSWLVKAHERARELGYKQGKSIVQLFVTGVIDDNMKDAIDGWPANSMVFSENALIDLFEPFGEGYIKEIIRRTKREK